MTRDNDVRRRCPSTFLPVNWYAVPGIGKRLRFVDEASGEIEIVGVVTSGKHITLGEDQRAAMYIPLRQESFGLRVAFLIARTRANRFRS